MKLFELMNVIDYLNINTKLKIKDMTEVSRKIEIDEWIITFTDSNTEIKIDAEEKDEIAKSMYQQEVVEYSLIEQIEVMESYYKKKNTIIRNVTCTVKVVLQS